MGVDGSVCRALTATPVSVHVKANATTAWRLTW
jgi:hypothetical protein